LIVDENVPKSVVEFLKRKGYSVMWVRESPYIGCDDEDIVELAKMHDACILTLDKDFGRIYYFKERGKITVCIVRVSPAVSGKIIHALSDFLMHGSFKKFKGCLVIITVGKIRTIC